MGVGFLLAGLFAYRSQDQNPSVLDAIRGTTGSSTPMHDFKAHLPHGQPSWRGLSAVSSQEHTQASSGTCSQICVTTSSISPQPLRVSRLKPDLDVLPVIVTSSFQVPFTFSGTAL